MCLFNATLFLLPAAEIIEAVSITVRYYLYAEAEGCIPHC